MVYFALPPGAMRLYQRQDAILVGGLAVACLIVFAPLISRSLDMVREAERQYGVTLLPGLIVLIGVFVFHQLQKRLAQRAHAAATTAASKQVEERVHDLDCLVSFGHALARSLDAEAIRAAVIRHLSALAGTDRVWVLLRVGGAWESLSPDARNAAGRELLADRLLNGESVNANGTLALPLLVGGTPIGVLGVEPPDGALDPARHRALEAAATLLAVSLKNAQLFREVRENSMRDSLTGCLVRTHAAEVIDAELRRARRSQAPVSMIIFDLDHFKQINDRHGHLCGDAVLAAVGRCMREVLRGSDLKCRYGGEEFLVLLPETPLAGARRVAETLRREIADRSVLWAGHTLSCTASFGLTQALPGETSFAALIARADAALYRAKDEGRNCVRIASDTLAAIDDQRAPNLMRQ